MKKVPAKILTVELFIDDPYLIRDTHFINDVTI